MDTERFQRIERLFLVASDFFGEKRAEFLSSECGDDTSLLAEVEAMLAHDGDTPLGAPNEYHRSLQAVLETVYDADSGVRIPKRIGRYKVLKRIGLGGMGAVYEAEQSQPHRRVALKVIRPDALSKEKLGRFLHEMEFLGRLQHRGIAQIFETGTFDHGEGEQPFFAMEYVDGQQLLEYAQSQRLTAKQRLALIAEVCDAVQHAHQQGVIHRDLKSDNVLVASDGKPKVLDFGVGRMIDADVNAKTAWTAAGQIVGTLAYMSPEQVSGIPGDVDTRSDVYAIGVMLYELLAEKLPFDLRRVSIAEAGRIICEQDPPRLVDLTGSSRGDVEAILGMTLEKEKARRYASASDLASDIRNFLNDRPIKARPTTTWYQLRKFTRRHRVAFIGVVATVLALTVGVLTTVVQAVRATRNASIAESNENMANHMAYRANIAAANSAIALGDALAARRHLDEAPIELQQWEWQYLNARIETTEAVYRAEPGTLSLIGQDARLAFHPDGTPLFLCATSKNLKVIDLVTRNSIATIPVETALVALALSSDGSRIAAIDDDLRMRVWDTASRRVQSQTALSHGEPLVAPHFSEDASMVEASSEHDVQIVEVRSGSLQTQHLIAPPLKYRAGAFIDKGKHIALHVGQSLRLVDTSTGKTAMQRPMPNCSNVIAGSPDGSRIVSGTDPQTHITRILAGSTLATLGRVGGHPRRARCAAFSADGRLLATGSSERIVVHDASTLEVRGSLFLPGLRADGLRWSPDRSRLLVAGAEEVRLVRWDAPPYLELRGHESFIYVAAWSPDGTMIASAGWDQTVRLWDARVGKPLAVLPFEIDFFKYVGFSADGTKILALPGDRFIAWDVATGRRVSIQDGTMPIQISREMLPSSMPGGAKFVQWASGGQNFATSPDNTLLLHDNRVTELATGVYCSILPDHGGPIRAVAASFDNRRIATGGWDGAVRVWDAVTGDQLALLEGQTVTPSLQKSFAAEIYSVEFSPDGKRLLSGGDDARVVLWDLESGKDVMTLHPHESYVHVVAFSPDGTKILSGAGDATLRIWDSVSLLERNREKRVAERLQAEMRPQVKRLLNKHQNPTRIAAILRADANLDPAHRRAALRVLLALSIAPG